MPYRPLHPAATLTVRRRSISSAAGTKRRETYSTIGTVTGAGIEDLNETDVRVIVSGETVRLHARAYADAAADLPVLRTDVVEFTDPATSQTRKMEVVDRRGPFRNSTRNDHFELDLMERQAGVV